MFSIGTGKLDITPPLGSELCGYGPYIAKSANGRKNTGVHSSLFTKALYIRSCKAQQLIITNDLVGISAELAAAGRNAIKTSLGLNADQICITCTHTHSGPNTLNAYGWGAPENVYLDWLPWRWVEVTKQAMVSEQPADIYTGVISVTPMGINRNGFGDQLDREVRIFGFKTNGQWRGLLCNHSLHAVVFGSSNTLVSADWPGQFTARLEAALDGCIVLFAQGMGGDINTDPCTMGYPEGIIHVERIGNSLADQVLDGLPSLEKCDASSLVGKIEEVRFPVQELTIEEVESQLEELEAKYTTSDDPLDFLKIQTGKILLARLRAGDESDTVTPLHIQRIGPLTIVTLGLELFHKLGREIIDRSPAPITMVMFGNGGYGYVPTPEIFQRAASGECEYDHYTILQVPWRRGRRPLAPEAGERLIDASVHLSKLLWHNNES